jgi:methionyl aminopeptidase
LASILKILFKEIKTGMTTSQLDEIAIRELTRYGAILSFKGYRGFPAAVCVPINEEIVHGIPGERK